MIKVILIFLILLSFAFDQQESDVLDANEFNPSYGVKNSSLYRYAQKFISESEPIIKEIEKNTRYEDSIYYPDLEEKRKEKKNNSYDGFQSENKEELENNNNAYNNQEDYEEKSFSFSSMANTFKSN